MDLDVRRYADWPELELYCHRVASAVGLLSIEIFGYRNPACRDYAVALGQAFQLTNILRDVRDDAARDRIYLPQMRTPPLRGRARGDPAGRLQRPVPHPGLRRGRRARGFYRQAAASLPARGSSRDDRRRTDGRGLLAPAPPARIPRRSTCSSSPRVRLSKTTKLCLVARTWWRLRIGPFAPNYGSA